MATAPHLRLMIIVALDSGARRGEMLDLTWADDEQPESDGNDLVQEDLGIGVDDGTRTRSVRSHSPVLYL